MLNSDLQEDDMGALLSGQIKLYTPKWKWFVLSCALTVFLAFFYLRYAQPKYDTLTTILISDPSQGRGLSELAAFSDLGAFADIGGSNNIDNEIEIIQSKTLVAKIVSDLGINISQYDIGGIKNVSIYEISPIAIDFKWNDFFIDDTADELSNSYEIKLISDTTFEILELDSGEKKEGVYNKGLTFEDGIIKVSKTSFFNLKEEKPLNKILVDVVPLSKYTEALQKEINVSPKSKRSNVLDLSLRLTDRNKARDILNTLVYQYNKQAIDDQNLVSQNTSKFIEERLGIISKELNDVEFEKAAFKKDNKLTNLEFEAGMIIEQVGESQKMTLELETQLALTESMLVYLNDGSRKSDLLPVDIGVDNESLVYQVDNYNKLVLERDRLLDVSTPFNPLVVNLNSEIESQRLNLLESLKNQKSNIEISKRDIKNQKGRINSRISKIPKQEKDYRVIERKQTIKETLYLFLLQKREETSISMAVTAPIAKVIDKAYSTARPVSPKKRIILLAAIILGMLIPFGVIYAKDLLDTKINEKSDIELILKDTPVLVETPRIKKGESDELALNDRSVLGESFRILRTNLNYFAKNKQKENKALRVFVTSTIKGEGKTFISYNTILCLADSSKKVLVVGADIRNPQLHRYFKNHKENKGLSEYLYDDELNLKDILSTTRINNHDIDYVSAGRIPPNPSELLMNGRLEHLLDQAESRYDYIVIDTAPTMLVTDTLLLTETADVTIYVVRAGYTEKELLQFTKGLIKDGKIKNLAVVLNDVDQSKMGFGYGYGYGVDEKKSLFQKIFKK